MSTVERAQAGATPRRVLVTGSRTWVSPVVIRRALQQVWGDGGAVLVTGACPTGADRIAEMFWRRWGGQVERHPANWQLHGRSAEMKRDAEMVAAGADVCVAFIRDGSPGASHTVRLAEHAGIPVYLHTHDATARAGEPAATDQRDDPPPAAEEPATDTAGTSDPPAVAATPGHAASNELPWQPHAQQAVASAVEVATHYSYPEVAALLARAEPGSDEARIARDALGLLIEQPELFAGGDQTTQIARHLSVAEITRQQQIVGHGPLFEVLGRAAELHHEQLTAVEQTGAAAGAGCEQSLRRARWAVDALNQQSRAERAAAWKAAGCPANWSPRPAAFHAADEADTTAEAAGWPEEPPALDYDGGQR